MYIKHVRSTVFALAAIAMFAGYVFFVSAAAPSGGYTPGATLDPDCAPGDTDCIVQSSGGGTIAIGDTIGNSPDPFAVLFTDLGGELRADGSIMSLAVDGTFNQTRGDYSFVNEPESFTYPGIDTFDFVGVRAEGTDSGNDVTSYMGIFGNDLVGGGDVIPSPGMYQFSSDGNQSGVAIGDSPMMYKLSPDYSNQTQFYVSTGDIVATLLSPSEAAWSAFKVRNWDGTDLFTVDTTGHADLGTPTVNTTSALLALNSTTSGFLAPRMSIAERDAISSPATGLQIYNTDDNEFNYYDGGGWSSIGGGGGSSLIGSTDTVGSETWLGNGAGAVGGSASDTVFLGYYAGAGATSASQSNFIGFQAGANATDAAFSNFFGNYAGYGAVNASNSNFIGTGAGQNSTNASVSNFFGVAAGSNAENASSSTFIGNNAGANASNSALSTFIGHYAGYNATNAARSMFFGTAAGYNDTVDNTVSGEYYSILIGDNSSTGGFSNSIALGAHATNTATNQFVLGSVNSAESSITEILLGVNSTTGIPLLYANLGGVAVGASTVDSSAILDLTSTTKGLLAPRMTQAERDAISSPANGLMVYNTDSNEYSYYNNILGWTGFNGIPNQTGNAGNFLVTDGTDVSWIGLPTGTLIGSTNSFATETWLGVGAGDGGASGQATTFIGQNAGLAATGASRSIFIGENAGQEAFNARSSTFIGRNAGINAQNASFSIFIGNGAGRNDAVDNYANLAFDHSILIGDNTSTGGFSNSIALGTGAQNTAVSQLVIGSRTTEGSIDEMFLGANLTNTYPLIYASLNGVAIGASTVDSSAILDLTSATKGFLAPRMSEAERDTIASPATGLFVYNTDTNAFNYYDGSAWTAIGGAGGGSLIGSTSTLGTETWLGEDAGANSGSFLGTTFIGYAAGDSAVNAPFATFVGSYAGQNATNAVDSVFVGSSAGFNADNASYSTFIGKNAGTMASVGGTVATATFIGFEAGINATAASNSTFIGYRAGESATNAGVSVFIGGSAGSNATNALNSIFLGEGAGANAANAESSIFIGGSAGLNDTVNNTGGGSSIAIGYGAGTGGFSSSIAFGTNAINTASNQFLVGATYNNWNIAGIDYIMPNGQGGAGSFLTNDGNGTLSWAGLPTGTLAGSTNSIADETWLGVDAGGNGASSTNTTFIGYQAGSGAVSSDFSTFVGFGSGVNAADSVGATFIGFNTGLNASNIQGGVFLGASTGSGSSGITNTIAIGGGLRNSSNISNSVFIGGQGEEGNGSNITGATYIGSFAGSNINGGNYSVGVGAGARAYYDYSIAIGYQAEATAVNQFVVGEGINGIKEILIGKNSDNPYPIIYGNLDGVSIGASTVDTSSILDLVSTTKGFLAPRMTELERDAIASPATGLFVYNTDTNAFNYYDGSAWGGIGAGLPDQTGNAGYILTTNGTTASWTTVPSGLLLGSTSSLGTETWLGSGAGSNSGNTSNTVFLGVSAGDEAVFASNSTFIGVEAGFEALNASNSAFFGYQAGYSADNASNSAFFGYQAGYSADNASNSAFFGYQAGYNADNAATSIFIGTNAGYGQVNAASSVMIGFNTGSGGPGNNSSINNVFIGSDAGTYTHGVTNSVFVGYATGQQAFFAQAATFLGINAGIRATEANYSVFIGPAAGMDAPFANNSIFIGELSGEDDTVDNSGDVDDYSILIGKNTSTGGFSNSIALGNAATNTAVNQFMIGSSIRPIDEIRVVQTGGTECIIDGTGLGCTSDERLKTNISDLGNDTLSKLLNVRTVSYNWNHSPNGQTNIGFLAQDLEQYFPELVSTNERGQKSVYYAQMTPVLVEAIRELDLKVSDFQDVSEGSTFGDMLRGWFADATNGIGDLFTKRVHTEELCVGNTCVTESQLQQLLQNQAGNSSNDPGLNEGNDDPVPDVPVVPESGDDEPADIPTEPSPVDEVTPTEPAPEVSEPEAPAEEPAPVEGETGI